MSSASMFSDSSAFSCTSMSVSSSPAPSSVSPDSGTSSLTSVCSVVSSPNVSSGSNVIACSSSCAEFAAVSFPPELPPETAGAYISEVPSEASFVSTSMPKFSNSPSALSASAFGFRWKTYFLNQSLFV